MPSTSTATATAPRKARPHEPAMTPEAFRRWREGLELSQQAAANLLGISRSTLQAYEFGHRKGDHTRAVVIPKPVRLACAAVLRGVTEYQGPPELAG